MTAIGGALPDDDTAVDGATVVAGMAAGLAAIERLGQAHPGDKTMIDTLAPFGVALADAVADGSPLTDAWLTALAAAEAGMRSTVAMISQRGRASRLGERSRGHQDAGATSMYIVLRTVGEVLSDAG